MAQKQQAVAESNVTGANMAEVAKRHGVRPALLSSWRRQLSPKAAYAAARNRRTATLARQASDRSRGSTGRIASENSGSRAIRYV